MARRREIEDPVVIEVRLPRAERDYVRCIADTLGQSMSFVIRTFVTTSLEKAEGRYHPRPSAEALVKAMSSHG